MLGCKPIRPLYREERGDKEGFPDLGRPGPESQSLTSLGKPKPKPVTQTSRTPVKEPPEDAIFTQFDGRPFFRKEDEVHATIQQEAFDLWQQGYQRMVNQTGHAVKQLTLSAIQHIHDQEIMTIAKRIRRRWFLMSCNRLSRQGTNMRPPPGS